MPASINAITLRPERSEDEPFLREVYASTRQEEMDAVGWPPAMREAFLNSQFSAQVQGYRATFPKADFQIILSNDQPVGRMVVNRATEEILLVDIALLPGYRNARIGTALMQRLLSEAAATGRSLRLSVIKGQRAFRLYQRLGFRKIGESDLRDEMEWRSDDRGSQPGETPCKPA